MNKFYAAIIGIFLLLFAGQTFGQKLLVSDSRQKELNDLSTQLNSSYLAAHAKAAALAVTHSWPVNRKTKSGGYVTLLGINSLGFPVYLTTHNNTDAAATTGTNQVQPAGSTGLNLSGSSSFLNNKIAM